MRTEVVGCKQVGTKYKNIKKNIKYPPEKERGSSCHATKHITYIWGAVKGGLLYLSVTHPYDFIELIFFFLYPFEHPPPLRTRCP
jgi:hypothetical protein